MLSDLLKKENILLNLESTEKEELFAEMVEAIIHIDSSSIILISKMGLLYHHIHMLC